MKKILLVMFGLMVAGALYAGNPTPVPSPTIVIDISGIINAITNLPNNIVQSFFTYLISGLASSSQQLVNAAFKFLFSNPNPQWFCAPYNGIMAIVETLYSLVLMALALYFILRSNDAEGRATAKKWLESMLIMMVVLAFSFQIFQMMLDFSNYLATSFANQSMKSMFQSPTGFGTGILALVMLIPLITGMFLTMATLIMRYLLIPFLLFLFPFAIFLYFTPIAHRWGRTFLTVIAAIVFMTALDGLILYGLSALANTSDPILLDPFAHAFAVMFGFSALGLANLAIFILAILSIIFQDKSVKALVGLTVAGKALAR